MGLSIFILAIIFVILWNVTGCGSSETSAKRSYDGTYKTHEDGANFTVAIKGDTIKIVLHIGNSSGIYWVGSFENPGDGKFSSTANTKILDDSLYGSQDKSKVFEIDGDSIQFKFSIMGTTTYVKADKQ